VPPTLPYGTWPSPVSAEQVVTAGSRPTQIWADGGVTWWSETRPAEGGREQIVRLDPGGIPRDLLPDGFNARTRAHEYGGGAWWVGGGTVFTTNFADQRMYRLDVGDPQPLPVTAPPPTAHAWRYADGRLTPDGRWVVCVRERHEGSDPARDVYNELVAMRAECGTPPHVIVSGRDFFAAPRISADGRQLAWITWDHPNMPWDGTELWLGRVAVRDGVMRVENARRVAGGPNESLMEPVWGRHGSLFVISDRTGWWNVHRVDGTDRLTNLDQADREVGGPAWVFGAAHVATASDGTVLAATVHDGQALLVAIPESGIPTEHALSCTAVRALAVDGNRLVLLVTSPDRGPEVVEADLRDPTALTVLRPAADPGLDPGQVSRPRRVSFRSAGRTAHAWYYPPTNPDAQPPVGERPPLLIFVHGGPTSAADPAFDLGKQFWTTRGFGVADLDYAGSTGLGRAYRLLLDGQWGEADLDDTCALADHLVTEGLADPARIAVRGGSAGGFTVLAVLARRDRFAAGVSYYGVADLAALARDTHKFESRYLDRLVGPLPDAADVYAARSALSHLDGFSCPLLVLQGLDDEVVPPAQSQAIVDALAERGLPHAYLTFEGEGHGFRRAENQLRCLTAELSFYGQVFGFTPAGGIEPITLVTGSDSGSGSGRRQS
jgi:dipeptidyl aminopeptidase/acylaminoacyl peptidase